MVVALRYFKDFGKPACQHITASISGGIYARVYCIHAGLSNVPVVFSFRGWSRRKRRSPPGRAVIILSINKRLLMRRQFTTNISTRGYLWRLKQHDAWKAWNPFSAGAPPRTPLGEITTLPRPYIRLGRGNPVPIPYPLDVFGVSARRLWRLGPRRLRRLGLGASNMSIPLFMAGDAPA